MTKIALVPAYQPDEHLLPLLESLRAAGFERVVVDDGGGEAYRAVFAAVPEGTAVLTHEGNRGKGQALKTGLSYIFDRYPPSAVVVTLDADGQHTVDDARRCAEAAEAAPDSLVLGVRTFGRSVPLRSRMGNRLTRLVYRLSSGVRLQDTQTGLRAFPPPSSPGCWPWRASDTNTR